jgi:hypothetical protein
MSGERLNKKAPNRRLHGSLNDAHVRRNLSHDPYARQPCFPQAPHLLGQQGQPRDLKHRENLQASLRTPFIVRLREFPSKPLHDAFKNTSHFPGITGFLTRPCDATAYVPKLFYSILSFDFLKEQPIQRDLGVKQSFDPYPDKERITFRPDGSFKLTVFSDLHYGENPWEDWGPEQDRNSTRLMRRVLKEEKPDFVCVEFLLPKHSLLKALYQSLKWRFNHW